MFQEVRIILSGGFIVIDDFYHYAVGFLFFKTFSAKAIYHHRVGFWFLNVADEEWAVTTYEAIAW